jgi:hypothetical protein
MAAVPTFADSLTFVLGVGAQKAGTSWLHDHLASSPQCDPGFMKEYHVWDGLDLEAMAHFRERLMKRTQRAAARMARGQRADPENLRLASFYADPEAYFDYFELLLSRPGIRTTTDITPSYAMLSAERLAAVRDGFARRGIRVAPVFLMREPAERIWSAVRMYKQRRPDRHDQTPEERVLEVYDAPWFELRTRYEHTMAALESVFGRDGVHYALYERLFEEPTVRELSAFVGIDPVPADTERRVNASPKSDLLRLPEHSARRVAEHYRSTYDAVAERLGGDLVAAAWPDQRWLHG